jgi:hypothetical protein
VKRLLSVILTTITITFSFNVYSQAYFFKDKEFYYNSYHALVMVKYKLKKDSLNKRYRTKKITYTEFTKANKDLEKEFKLDKNKVNTKYKSFSAIERENSEKCDYKSTSLEMPTEENVYYGLWYLNYIDNKKYPMIESNVAIIDGYLSTNRLLPNTSIKNCRVESENKSCNNGWDLVNKTDNIYKAGNPHTYWLASVLAGHNCANSKSEFKQIGVNPLANLMILNVSKRINDEDQHSLNKTIEAIGIADKNDVDVIYIPLSFTQYTQDQYDAMHNAVTKFLRKENRAIVSVFGNEFKIDPNASPLPCITDKVICLGGLSQYGALWGGANNDSLYIDGYAPAVNIVGGLNKNGYRVQESGVSASGAIVAGMISKIIHKENYKELLDELLLGKKFIFDEKGEIRHDLKAISF